MSFPKSPAADDARVIETYYYADEQGHRWGRVERTDPKGFRQSWYFQKDWHPGKPPGPKKPYNLHKLVHTAPDIDVWVTEGEKDANRLIAEGLLATTASEGAGKFTSDLVPWFMGRSRVFILQDNDRAGREHAHAVASLLRPVVGQVRIVTFDELPEHGDVSDWFDAGGTKDALLERAQAAPRFKEAISASPFILPDASEIPRREWLYWPHYIRGYVSLTVAPGGLGKSALQTSEILAMVTGKALLGVTPMALMRVWYLNLEDPMDELHRRFAAAAKHFGVSREEIGDRLFLNSGRTTPFVLAAEKNRTALISESALRDTVETIRANAIDIMVVDPVVASHRLQENDNAQIDALARTYAQIAEQTQTAVMLVHHTRKLGTDRATVDDGRGASALLAAARSARVLSPMSAKEASDINLDDRERPFYFRADHGKANLTPPADRSTWFHMRSVDLENQSRDLDHGDSVGVVTSFTYLLPQRLRVSRADMQRILDKVGTGKPWRAHPSASAWVGHAVAEVMCLTPLEGAAKKQVAMLVPELIKAGVLVEVQRRDNRSVMRDFIDAGQLPSEEAVKEEHEHT